MKNSTKWFLIIAGSLMLMGFGFLLLFVVAVTGLGDRERDVVIGSGDKIAEIDLRGIIISSDNVVRQIKKYRDDRGIRAILLHVESPGGGVVASQEIYEELRKTRDGGKPVVVSMGSLAASGGYYVSCGASRIVANEGTLTGSIGVISQFMHYDSLMHKIGVGVNTVKSGKLKDAGNPFRAMTEQDRAYFQDLMDEVHRQFIAVVEKERKIDHDSLLAIADGRAFTGVRARGMGLVDTIGTYEDAIAIAARLGGIKGEPAIVRERRDALSLFDLFFGKTQLSDLLDLKHELLDQPVLQYRMPQAF